MQTCLNPSYGVHSELRAQAFYLRESGMALSKISEICRVDPRTIQTWLKTSRPEFSLRVYPSATADLEGHYAWLDADHRLFLHIPTGEVRIVFPGSDWLESRAVGSTLSALITDAKAKIFARPPAGFTVTEAF